MRKAVLTDREYEVLRRVARGMSAEEIGRELFISENTVKTHLKRIYKRLGAVNAAHAVALAYTHGAFWKGELYKTLEKD